MLFFSKYVWISQAFRNGAFGFQRSRCERVGDYGLKNRRKKNVLKSTDKLSPFQICKKLAKAIPTIQRSTSTLRLPRGMPAANGKVLYVLHVLR